MRVRPAFLSPSFPMLGGGCKGGGSAWGSVTTGAVLLCGAINFL